MDVLEELREAGDVGTRPKRLEELSRHGDKRVRRAVAGNGNTPWGVLEGLAKEFPREFLHNPVGVLQMVGRPEEIRDMEEFWSYVLWVEDVPEVWVMWLRQHPRLSDIPSAAMHVKVAGEIVDRCDGYVDKNMRMMLAICQQTPREILEKLVEDEDREVRVRVACNKALSGDMLSVLAKDESYHVRMSVAGNEGTPVEALALLAKDALYWVRDNVARNGEAPEEVLRQLAGDEKAEVRSVTASHPNTPVDVLKRLACDEGPNVRRSVAGNNNTPKDVLYILMHDKDSQVSEVAHYTLACRMNVSEEELRWLATHADSRVRLAVGRTKKTPQDVLKRLAMDREESVRWCVAGNESAAEEIICGLVRDPAHTVRQQVVLHSRLPLAELERLERDKDEEVRNRAKAMRVLRGYAWGASLHVSWIYPSHCPHDRELVRYLDWLDSLPCSQEVRSDLVGLLPFSPDVSLPQVLQRPTLPESMLRKCARSANWEHRWLVAMHPRVPEDVREGLRWDGNRVVRAAARGVWGW